MTDEALKVLIDDSYTVYDQLPLDVPDAWGDLESFRAAAGVSSARPPE